MLKVRKITFVVLMLAGLMPMADASFYRADTLAEYCGEYLNYIELRPTRDSLQAGICSGYFASSLDLMNLSGGLCQQNKINLDDAVRHYVQFVNNDASSQQQSASYVVVKLLESLYACDE